MITPGAGRRFTGVPAFANFRFATNVAFTAIVGRLYLRMFDENEQAGEVVDGNLAIFGRNDGTLNIARSMISSSWHSSSRVSRSFPSVK